jgi:hypothetical protein
MLLFVKVGEGNGAFCDERVGNGLINVRSGES